MDGNGCVPGSAKGDPRVSGDRFDGIDDDDGPGVGRDSGRPPGPIANCHLSRSATKFSVSILPR